MVLESLHGGPPFRAGECFKNCQGLLERFKDILSVEASPIRYVEGFVIYSPIPIHHAWLSISGKIVDPTLPAVGPPGPRGRWWWSLRHRVLGVFPPTRLYVGVELPWGVVHRHMMETKLWGPVLDPTWPASPLNALASS
jgi:hypothetical protein